MAAPTPAISVVVPTFGRPGDITRLAAQLAAQTLSPDAYQVIVVDDGSRVDVRTLLRPADYRFELLVERQENAGSAAARQRGAERATGDLLVFVDDDMHVGPDYLQAHLQAHQGDDRLVVLGQRRAGEGAELLHVLERYRVTMGDQLARDVSSGRVELSGVYVYTGNVSMPRALFHEVGGFDPALREICDVELGLRLEKAGARFVLSEAAFNVHDRDAMTTEQWLARGQMDGRYWARVGHKHGDMSAASPWHWLGVLPPAARPLLAGSALAPGAGGLLARAGLACVNAAGAAGLESVAMSGASFVWAVQMFRGVGQEAGDTAAALREYRAYRRGFKQFAQSGGKAPSPFRELIEAVKQDHRALADSHLRYDPRWRETGTAIADSAVNAGFQIVFGYRVMRCMRALGLPLAARLVSRGLRHAFGADIHWDAELAPGLVVVHGFGLAISHAARTGPGCILAQNVTLGFSRDPVSGITGAPELGRNVAIGPGAALSGPIVVGDDTKVMANCTLMESVPARSVVEAPAVTIRPR
jgi:serine acetyltransferase/GT2 family glycosyltransferase